MCSSDPKSSPAMVSRPFFIKAPRRMISARHIQNVDSRQNPRVGCSTFPRTANRIPPASSLKFMIVQPGIPHCPVSDIGQCGLAPIILFLKDGSHWHDPCLVARSRITKENRPMITLTDNAVAAVKTSLARAGGRLVPRLQAQPARSGRGEGERLLEVQPARANRHQQAA